MEAERGLHREPDEDASADSTLDARVEEACDHDEAGIDESAQAACTDDEQVRVEEPAEGRRSSFGLLLDWMTGAASQPDSSVVASSSNA